MTLHWGVWMCLLCWDAEPLMCDAAVGLAVLPAALAASWVLVAAVGLWVALGAVRMPLDLVVAAVLAMAAAVMMWVARAPEEALEVQLLLAGWCYWRSVGHLLATLE